MDLKKLSKEQIKQVANEFGLTYAKIKTVIDIESGGKGFDDKTGKILIQFEPHWFKRKSPYTPSGLWSVNKVEVQSKEWIAFSDAFAKDPNSAMESTSIGLMQVMGFHWKLLGFKSVGEMWDYAKVSEANQLRIGLRFIQSNIRMYRALVDADWRTFAYYYNGEQYEKFNYHNKLANTYSKYHLQNG